MTDRLYRYEVDTDPAALEPGPMIVAFDGFFDAGMAQRLLVDHLLEASEPTVVASFDVDDLIDYRSRRPVITFDANRYTDYNDPALVLYHLTDRDGQSYYVLTGPEPDYRWEAVVSAVTTIMDDVGISLAVHAHGIPMAVPHTRPVGMTVHGSDERLIGEHKPVFGTVQVPASLAALLELRLGESSRDAVGFSLHVPHYLAQSTFHDAALTGLTAIVDCTGLNRPTAALAAAAREGRLQIEREVQENDEVREAVEARERHYDLPHRRLERPSRHAGAGANIPSADEIGADFEDFLRTVDDSDNP